MPDSSSKGLNSFKKWLLFRKHDALKSLSEPLLNKFLELKVSNFVALNVRFQSKSEFCLESMTHCKLNFKRFWMKFELKLSNLFVETILEMSDSSSEGLISVKKWLLSRKHDVLQIQFEALLNQVLELIVSNFLAQTILEMPNREAPTQ